MILEERKNCTIKLTKSYGATTSHPEEEAVTIYEDIVKVKNENKSTYDITMEDFTRGNLDGENKIKENLY